MQCKVLYLKYLDISCITFDTMGAFGNFLIITMLILEQKREVFCFKKFQEKFFIFFLFHNTFYSLFMSLCCRWKNSFCPCSGKDEPYTSHSRHVKSDHIKRHSAACERGTNQSLKPLQSHGFLLGLKLLLVSSGEVPCIDDCQCTVICMYHLQDLELNL